MGFDVIGPTRRVKASNVDDGVPPLYDVLELPREFGLQCQQLRRLHERFYESTTVSHGSGGVAALRDELREVRAAYRSRRERELARERGVRACNPAIRGSILQRMLEADVVDRVLAEFVLLCEEAIAAGRDVQCEGD